MSGKGSVLGWGLVLVVASWGLAGGSGPVSREPGVATDSHFPIPCGAITCQVVGLIDSRCDTHTCSKLRLNDAGAGNEGNTLNTSSAAGKASANLYWGNQQVYLQGTDLSAASGTFSGNVGIGKTSPTHKLDIVGSIGLDRSAGGGRPALLMDLSGSKWIMGIQDDGRLGIGTGSAGSGWDVGADTISILSNGNVGIGTATPRKALDVEGPIRTARGVQFPDNIAVGDGGTLRLCPFAEGFFLAYRSGHPSSGYAFGVRAGGGETVLIAAGGTQFGFSAVRDTPGKINLFDGGAANDYCLMAQNLAGATFNLRLLWLGDVQ